MMRKEKQKPFESNKGESNPHTIFDHAKGMASNMKDPKQTRKPVSIPTDVEVAVSRFEEEVGSGFEEAVGGSSRKDFINKLQIAYKESRETRYWLRLLREGDVLEKKLADSFLKDCEEIIAILTAILNSSKGRNS